MSESDQICLCQYRSPMDDALTNVPVRFVPQSDIERSDVRKKHKKCCMVMNDGRRYYVELLYWLYT
jgi:hypothetical protein